MTMGMMPGPGISGGGSGGDPFWSSVLSLLYFNGTNGSTTITDQVSGSTWAAHGAAALSNAALPYAGSTTSLHVPLGTGNYVLSNASTSYWAPMVSGSSPWTVDCLISMPSTPTTSAVIFDLGGVATNNHGTAFVVNTSNNFRFLWANSFSGTYLADLSLGTIAANTFTLGSVEFIPSVGAHGTFYMYQDGVLLGSHALPSAAPASGPTNAAQIGAYFANNTLNLGGYIGQMRFTAAARYGGASFTPPSTYFPNHA